MYNVSSSNEEHGDIVVPVDSVVKVGPRGMALPLQCREVQEEDSREIQVACIWFPSVMEMEQTLLFLVPEYAVS